MNMVFVIIFIYFKIQLAFHSYEALLFKHPDVSNFYLRMTRIRTVYRLPDLFEGFNGIQRKKVCEMVLQSDSYSLMNANTRIQEDHENERFNEAILNIQEVGPHQGVTEEELSYVGTMIPIHSAQIMVKMFPCLVSPVGVYLVTYGFRPYYIFIIVKTYLMDTSTFQIVEVFEKEPPTDETLSHHSNAMNDQFWTLIDRGTHAISTPAPRYMVTDILDKEYFAWTVIHSLNEESPMEFHSLSEFQHFRTCITVAQRLKLNVELELNIRKQNWIYPMTDIRLSKKGILKDDKSIIVYANVLPCAINRTWENPQFFLLRHPNILTSVFVFKTMHDPIFMNALRLEAKIDNVAALFDI